MLVDITKFPREEIRRELDVSKIGEAELDHEDLVCIFRALGIWYDYGEAKRIGVANPPHPFLPSGVHTNCYLMHSALFHNAQITEILAQQLARKLKFTRSYRKLKWSERLEHREVWVVGPSYGATFLVGAMANYLRCWQGVTCKVVGKDQEWQSLPISKGSLVQLVDDLIFSVTADSLMATRNAIKELLTGGMIKLNREIGAVVNMSGKKTIGGFRVKSLINLPAPRLWQADVCELCKMGSKPLSIQDEWSQLAEACWRDPIVKEVELPT